MLLRISPEHLAHSAVLAASVQRVDQRIHSLCHQLATFTQDHLGKLISMTRYLDPIAGTIEVQSSWRFDSLGQVLQFQEPESAPQFNKYSDWGELLEVQWTDATVSPPADRRVASKYDALGRVTR